MALHAPEQLSAPVRVLFAHQETVPAASVVSLMELIVKVQKGKITLAPDPIRWWRLHLAELNLAVLPLKQSHVEHLWTLPLIHRDPADRLLIVQAIAEGLPLVSPDEVIRRYPLNVLW
jgi:PIN domain nuclease of toxin-antitoxin system